MTKEHVNVPKGHQVPLTVESLLAIMEVDAIRMEQMGKEITQLKVQVKSLQDRLMKRGL